MRKNYFDSFGITKELFETWVEPCPTTGCWLWLRGVNGYGYGKQVYLGKRVLATEVSWRLYKTELIGTLFILHRCDVKLCVNPAHLWLGTKMDNLWDAKRKGINWQNTRKGQLQIWSDRKERTNCLEGW